MARYSPESAGPGRLGNPSLSSILARRREPSVASSSPSPWRMTAAICAEGRGVKSVLDINSQTNRAACGSEASYELSLS